MWCISSCWSQFSLGYRYLKVFLLFSSLSIQILFFHSYVAINLNQYQVQGDIIKCLYPYKLISYCCYVFYLVFICGPYILRVQTDSLESVNIFSIVAHVFRNLFWKICPLFGKILITCLKSCKATYSKKMHWGEGGKKGTPVQVLPVNSAKKIKNTIFTEHLQKTASEKLRI